MFDYRYEAMDARGTEIKDVMRAENEQAAMEKIRQLGYFITRIALDKPITHAIMPVLLSDASVKDLLLALLFKVSEKINAYL